MTWYPADIQYPEIIIKGLKFVQTCSGCPEQYDIYDGRGKLVGYFRLRWGSYRWEFMDEVIGSGTLSDHWIGSFPDEQTRAQVLGTVAKSIKKRLRELRKNGDE